MKTPRITELGMLLAVSLVLSYLESVLPAIVTVPGVKIGLANIITMLVLYRWNWKNALLFMTVRVVLSGFLFSGMVGIVYSFAGGLCCIFIMNIARKCSFFSSLGVSMAGAVAHNAGQILVAASVMENIHILYYFPVLCVSGVIGGFIVGYLSNLIIEQYNKNI